MVIWEEVGKEEVGLGWRIHWQQGLSTEEAKADKEGTVVTQKHSRKVM